MGVENVSALTPDQIDQLTTMEKEGRLPPALAPRLEAVRRQMGINTTAVPGPGGGPSQMFVPNSSIQGVVKQEVLPVIASGAATMATDVGLASPHPVVKGAALATSAGLQYLAGKYAEKGNQALGITPPDEKAQETAGIIPATIDALTRPIGVIRGMLGRKGSFNLNNIGLPEIAANAADFNVTRGAVDQAMARATQTGQMVDMSGTLRLISGYIAELSRLSTPPAEAIKRLQNMRRKIVAQRGRFTMQDVNSELEGLGDAWKSGPGQAESSAEGKLRDTYRQLYDDLHLAPGEQLSGARDLYKRHISMNEFVKAGEAAYKSARGQGANNTFNAAQVMNKLRDNPFFMDLMDKNPEVERVLMGTLEKLNEIPALPAARGINQGFKEVGQRAINAGAAAYGGTQATGFKTVGAALAVGTWTYPQLKGFLQNVWLAAQMKKGRELMTNLMTQTGNIREAAAPLSAYIYAAQNDPRFRAEQEVQ